MVISDTIPDNMAAVGEAMASLGPTGSFMVLRMAMLIGGCRGCRGEEINGQPRLCRDKIERHTMGTQGYYYSVAGDEGRRWEGCFLMEKRR